MSALRRLGRAAAALVRLILPHRHHALGVDMASIGELQFCRDVLCEYARRNPEDVFFVFHRDSSGVEFDERCPELRDRVVHFRFGWTLLPFFRRLDLYITTEQFVPGPRGVYTLTLFHGQPAKGLTFRLPISDALLANDALFLYGPLQRQTLAEHLEIWGVPLPPHLELFEVGYTKSDALLQGRFHRAAILRELGLDPARRTILYAPAFNEGASMRECGVDVLNTLCALPNVNVLAKLAIDCLQPTTNDYATGGVNWFETIGRLEREHPNFRLVRDLEADPALAAADVLITCVSSIGFEFLALRRPVIYLRTPKFFAQTLRTFFPDRDCTAWEERTCANGGREFGLVVDGPAELPAAVDEVLAWPDLYPRRQHELPDRLIYNAGRATPVAVEKIESLLRQGVRSRRPGDEGRAVVLALLRWDSPVQRLPRALARRVKRVAGPRVERWLNARGYALRKTGLDYISAEQTVAAARAKGVSVAEHLDQLESEPRKKGRRDRIIAQLDAAGVFREARTVCEIGAGTGQFLEKVVERASPRTYEVYETDAGWTRYLASEYGGRLECRVVCHPADGRSLRFTASGACDLVHAHGVFVYLPLVQTFEYLEECVRVCAPGGYIVFDCYTDGIFPLAVVEAWRRSAHRFAVVLPEGLLAEFAAKHRLALVTTFRVPHAASEVNYVIWRKPA